jgi:hypothetical protein
MIFARFSRSASAWRAIARFIVSGSWMSFSSTSVTLTPHSSVWHVEDLADVLVDLVGLRQRLVERVRPTTARSVVCAIWLIASSTFSIATTADRVLRPEVGDGGDVDADVVAGDDALRLDRHRDDPQRHAVS